mgnify:CR=1 FL=1
MNAQVYITARNTTSGGAVVAGLPFTSQNVNAANGAVTVGIMGGGTITAGTSISGYIQQNSSEISLRYWDQTYGNSGLEAGDVADTFYISMCAVYTV